MGLPKAYNHSNNAQHAEAPPGTGEGGVNDNTGVWEDASLADGTWILLLLSVMMLCFKISTKKTKS